MSRGAIFPSAIKAAESDPLANNRSDDPPIAEKIIIALPENPVGTADLGFDRRQSFDLAIPQNIEIPPACPVGTESKSAAGCPPRLHDRFQCFARHAVAAATAPSVVIINDVKLRSIPRHPG